MEIIRVSIATNDALPAECTSAYYGHFTTISVELHGYKSYMADPGSPTPLFIHQMGGSSGDLPWKLCTH